MRACRHSLARWHKGLTLYLPIGLERMKVPSKDHVECVPCRSIACVDRSKLKVILVPLVRRHQHYHYIDDSRPKPRQASAVRVYAFIKPTDRRFLLSMGFASVCTSITAMTLARIGKISVDAVDSKQDCLLLKRIRKYHWSRKSRTDVALLEII